MRLPKKARRQVAIGRAAMKQYQSLHSISDEAWSSDTVGFLLDRWVQRISQAEWVLFKMGRWFDGRPL